MAIPPDKNHLQALAGWAIHSRQQCSDHQHLALCHFQEGCEELAEVVEDIVPVRAPTRAPTRHPRAAHAGEAPREEVVATIPIEVQQAQGVQQSGECAHKFHIKTQCCIYCGITYRKAHGVPSELM